MTAKKDIAITLNWAAVSGSVRRFVVHLFRCRHEWHTTGTNGFYVTTEECCWKCGEYRHRILSAECLYETPKWKDGKHPKR